MKRLAASALVPLTLACAVVPPDSEAGGRPADRCDASSLGNLVGRAATQELGAEALRRSGARMLRWIRPGDVVTMDYSEQRLNIHLDAQNRVDRFICG
jgi:hypothetical protein